jgi:ER degradation enhancer, mannosidase alpha-like 2
MTMSCHSVPVVVRNFHFRVFAISFAVSTFVVVGSAHIRPTAQTLAPDDRAQLAASVRAEFQHAWSSYKRLAWDHDELNPVTRTPHDWYPPTVVYMTAVDALDTMTLMGLSDDAAETRRYLLDHLSFDQDVPVQVFEVTIRLLGGLLSAYQMSGEPKFLTLAEDLGNRLLPAFNSPTGMPYRFVNLRTGKTTGEVSNPAEIGTLMLEFGALGKLTHREVFYDTAKHAISDVYRRRDRTTGLVGEEINVETGAWASRNSHIGGGIDSYYEYLLKCQKLFGDEECGAMYREGIAAVNKYLADDGPGGLWYGVSDMTTGARTATTYGSLEAFLPSVLALGGDLDRARRLQDSNFKMWTLHGIEPEVLDYSTMKATVESYQLRPEIIESAYYLFHATHDPKYQAMGRVMFEDLVKYCRTDDGYTVLESVVTKARGDRQHSFFLAETLKYLYLLFAPESTLDLDQVVFNTEAHPLRRTW